MQLPIYDIEGEIVRVLHKENRLVVQAPTGSGKSTQVPQILLEHGLAGNGQIVILQPRRIAARLLAARVARERGVPLGDEVGYQIRLEDRSSSRTRIKFETEGILLRQMLTRPDLDGVGAILFDEFHERHLYGDVTLARALLLQQSRRPDLKLLVMSATLEVDKVVRYLAPCAKVCSEGRMFPVTHEYLARPVDEKKTPLWDVAAGELDRLVREGREGDVLVFMPGAYEIHRSVEAIRRASVSNRFMVLPLHGELPSREQDAAVATYDQRKVVVATNVAETSLTIEGVALVIDSGLARVPRFDPHRGIDTLLVEKISRASADQRAGRAGRTAPGHCLRLWTEQDHRGRALQEIPEVRRLDLAEVVLTLKAGGVHNVAGFPWLEPPDPKSLARAELLLRDLGATDARGAITEIGGRMVSFPVHPRYARMLLAAHTYGCVRQVALIAALTQGRSILVRTWDKQVLETREEMLGSQAASDFFLLMRAWIFADRNRYDVERCRRLGIHAGAARQVGPLFQRFLGLAESQGLTVEEKAAEDAAVQKCVLAGFADQVARRLDKGTLRCELVHGRRGDLVRESVVQDHPLLVISEVNEIEGRRRDVNVLLSLATAIDEAWLHELFPEDFAVRRAAQFDASTKRVVAFEQRVFRDLVFEQRRTEEMSDNEAARILAGEIVSGRASLKRWDHTADQFLARIGYLGRMLPELAMPEVNDATRHLVIEQICHGARSLKDVKDREVLPALRTLLSPAQQEALRKYAPERVPLPGGREAKVVYAPQGAPAISARIQELYGVESSLRLPGGREPLLIHVLAPNHRPVQVTQDLSTFWREAYPKVKSELQRKYPKHEWR